MGTHLKVGNNLTWKARKKERNKDINVGVHLFLHMNQQNMNENPGCIILSENYKAHKFMIRT